MLNLDTHILSAHFGLSAEHYESITSLLGAQGVLPKPLQERLTGLGGFRNILVHGSLRIDPSRVAEALATAPRDFSAFAEAVRTWLAEAIPSQGSGS